MLTPFSDAQMFGQVYLVSLISLSFYWEEHWKRKVRKKNYHTFEKNLGDQKNPKKIIPKLYTPYSQMADTREKTGA